MPTIPINKAIRPGQLSEELRPVLGANFPHVINILGFGVDDGGLAASGAIIIEDPLTQADIQPTIDAHAPESDHNVTFTGNRNNLPLRDFNYYSIQSTLAVTITGIQATVHGRIIRATNIGSNNITFANASASSLPANRIINPAGGNYVLAPNFTIELVYNTDVNRWGIIR